MTGGLGSAELKVNSNYLKAHFQGKQFCDSMTLLTLT